MARRFGRLNLVSRVTSNDPENIITITAIRLRPHNTHRFRRRRIAPLFRFTNEQSINNTRNTPKLLTVFPTTYLDQVHLT